MVDGSLYQGVHGACVGVPSRQFYVTFMLFVTPRISLKLLGIYNWDQLYILGSLKLPLKHRNGRDTAQTTSRLNVALNRFGRFISAPTP